MKKSLIFVIIYLFSNFINAQCLGSQIFTLNPAGPYIAGQTVTVTYTLNNFIQTNSNWIIAFDIDCGSGWSSISPVSAPGNTGGSSGSWIWDTQNTYPSGLNFGPGYRFQNSSWFNPNWGTSSTGPFTLSFQLTVGTSCINQDLLVDINVIGDCQTGGWSNGACCSITPFNIYNSTSTGNSTSNTTNHTQCDSYTWVVNNQTYTTSGTYTDIGTNAAGCMHTETLNLTVDNSTTSTDPQTACDSYTWIDGNTYSASNNSATFTSTNAAGCDDVATLNLIINNSTTSTDPQTACDSYTWIDGNTYSASNNSATFTSTNAAGCDNVATLNLTINNSTTSTDPQTACDSYTWIDGNTYSASNNSATFTSTNAAGCDDVATLNLIINNSTTSTDPQTACDSYTWIDGNTYTVSNNSATFTSTNAAGCDNVATLNLTINNSTTSTDPQTACDSYTWIDGNTYTVSNNSATFTSTNAAGCTHTETLNLVVGYSNQIDLIIVENDISCFGYNDGSINIIPNGGTPPYQYSWDNGALSQSISALSARDYSFSFTDSNGCALDSVATINEANQIFLDFIAASPICRYDESTLSINISNSTSNTYTLSLQDSILKSFVIDTNGLLIPAGAPITLSPNFSGEVYIVSLTDEEGCTQIFNDDVHIEVKQSPQLAINEVDVCEGSPSFTLNNATPNGGFYSVNNELTNYLDVENLGAGIYNIGYTYTDPITSCTNQINEVITIMESPKAEMLFSPQPTNIDNPNIFFRDNSNEMVLYSEWNLGDGTVINDEINFWYTYSDTGTYTIKYYITNMYQCTDSVIKDLTINPIYITFIPDAFTPNNDGDNDYFYPSIIGGSDYNMKIYNRWGEIIYNEDNGAWNGKLNNKTVQNGTYSYTILVSDFKDKPFIYTGNVTLIK